MIYLKKILVAFIELKNDVIKFSNKIDEQLLKIIKH
jgi:hypothetical protein